MVIRRKDGTSIEVEVVREGSRRVWAWWPPDAVEASIPQSSATNTGQVNIPAAHEVEQNITNIIVRYVKSKTYTTGIGFAKD